MDQATRNDLQAIATRWDISTTTVETEAKMAVARMRREGVEATQENAARALKQASQTCLYMADRMLARPEESAGLIRQQIDQSPGWHTSEN